METAAGIAETVAAICAFACGRPVNYPPVGFSFKDAEKISLAQRRQPDSAILGLARDRISLDVFRVLPQLGDLDAGLRVRSALLAYHVALDQAKADVA